MGDSNVPEVFIIESNRLEDEQMDYSEGEVLCQILRMMGKKPIYYYIRTTVEMVKMAEQFAISKYRYLHLACHGCESAFCLTLQNMTFQEFAATFRDKLASRRLFLSACSVTQPALARQLFRDHRLAPYSICGPNEDILFSDAAATWASLYNLAFKYDAAAISGRRLRNDLAALCKLNDIRFSYFGKIRKSPHYKQYDFPT